MRKKYDLELLNKLSNENKVILKKSYEGEYLNYVSIIESECLTKGCLNNVTIKFRTLFDFGCYCIDCKKIVANERKKQTNLLKYGDEIASRSEIVKETRKKNNLERTGYESPLHNPEIRQKIKKSFLEKYGVENPFQAEVIKEKIKEVINEKYGTDHVSKSEFIKEKKKETTRKNYGVDHGLQSKEIREKIKNTCLKKYGVENAFQSCEIREKIKNSNIKKYGKQNYSQTDEFKKKYKETVMRKYGVEHTSQSTDVKEKMRKNSLEKYGVEFPCQNKEIIEKISKNSYKYKKYKMPSGKIIKIQGYENLGLDELVKTHNEKNIIVDKTKVPEIWYVDLENKRRRHFVDIFIDNKNLCIEIKSTWTFAKKKDNVFLKRDAAIQLGYNYEIWVYNQNGIKVEKIDN